MEMHESAPNRECSPGHCDGCYLYDICPSSTWKPPHPAHHNRPRVYIAGPLSHPDCTGYISHVHTFIAVAVRLRRAGFAPYNPSLDLLEGIAAGDLGYDDYFDTNIVWLDAADVLYLIGRSPGADREVERAHALGIPVVHSVEELLRWREGTL